VARPKSIGPTNFVIAPLCFDTASGSPSLK
jgi:hypothetical protein